jgi:hypothetical protein
VDIDGTLYSESVLKQELRLTLLPFPSLIQRPSQKSVKILNNVMVSSINTTLAVTQKPRATIKVVHVTIYRLYYAFYLSACIYDCIN